MANRKMPEKSSSIRAMFMTATEGKPDALEGSSWTPTFRDFIAKCLTFDVRPAREGEREREQ